MRSLSSLPLSLCLRSPLRGAGLQGRAAFGAVGSSGAGCPSVGGQRTAVAHRERSAHPSTEPSSACAVQLKHRSACQQGAFAPRMRPTRLFSFRSCRFAGLRFTTAACSSSMGLTKIQMQIPGSAFPLRLPLAGLAIQVAVVRAWEQPANHSIEATNNGVQRPRAFAQAVPPLFAPHLKR